MAKRFTSTEIWNEDWFIEMPLEYKFFWFYILSSCDHSGLFKINLKMFCTLHNVQIDQEIAIELFNKGKKRIRKVNGSMWLIEDFFLFQYGKRLNIHNTVHMSIKEQYNKYGVELGSIRGLTEVSERVKDKDKDKDK